MRRARSIDCVEAQREMTRTLGRLSQLERQLRNAFLLALESQEKPSLAAALRKRTVDAGLRRWARRSSKRVRVWSKPNAPRQLQGSSNDALRLTSAHADDGEDAARSDRVRASAQSLGLAAEDEQRALIALIRCASPEQTRETPCGAAQKRIAELMPQKAPSERLACGGATCGGDAVDQSSLHASLRANRRRPH